MRTSARCEQIRCCCLVSSYQTADTSGRLITKPFKVVDLINSCAQPSQDYKMFFFLLLVFLLLIYFFARMKTKCSIRKNGPATTIYGGREPRLDLGFPSSSTGRDEP